MYYEAFEKGYSESDIVLNRVNQYLKVSMGSNFTGTFMILAEWQNVHPYPYGSDYYYYFQRYYPGIRSYTKQVLHLFILIVIIKTQLLACSIREFLVNFSYELLSLLSRV